MEREVAADVAAALKVAIENCEYVRFKELFGIGSNTWSEAALENIVAEFKKLTLKPVGEWKQHPAYYGADRLKVDADGIVSIAFEPGTDLRRIDIALCLEHKICIPANILYVAMYKQEPEVFEALARLGVKFTLDGEDEVYRRNRITYINPLSFMIREGIFFGRSLHKDKNSVMNVFMRLLNVCLEDVTLEDFTIILLEDIDATVLELFKLPGFLRRLEEVHINAREVFNVLRAKFESLVEEHTISRERILAATRRELVFSETVAGETASLADASEGATPYVASKFTVRCDT